MAHHLNWSNENKLNKKKIKIVNFAPWCRWMHLDILASGKKNILLIKNNKQQDCFYDKKKILQQLNIVVFAFFQFVRCIQNKLKSSKNRHFKTFKEIQWSKEWMHSSYCAAWINKNPNEWNEWMNAIHLFLLLLFIKTRNIF